MLKVVQHTPAVSVRDGTSNVSHDLLAKLLEKLALQWFGEVVSDHFLSGQIFDHDIAFLHLICNKKVTNVNCSGPLARALLTVVFQQNGALVVLIKNVLRDFVALGFQKQLGPKNWGGTVIHSDQFLSNKGSWRAWENLDYFLDKSSAFFLKIKQYLNSHSLLNLYIIQLQCCFEC